MSEMFLPPYVPKTTTYVPKIFGNRVLLLVIHLSGKKRKVSLFGGSFLFQESGGFSFGRSVHYF